MFSTMGRSALKKPSAEGKRVGQKTGPGNFSCYEETGLGDAGFPIGGSYNGLYVAGRETVENIPEFHIAAKQPAPNVSP